MSELAGREGFIVHKDEPQFRVLEERVYDTHEREIWLLRQRVEALERWIRSHDADPDCLS